MSKRAGAVSAETKQLLLTAARDEFAARGFSGSSLRRICAAAGVTTGALYFFFQGKDDLFAAVLAQVTEPFTRLMEAHYQAEQASDRRDSTEGADADLQVVETMIDLCFRSRETWNILLAHQSHPVVRDFLEAVNRVSTEHYLSLLEDADPFAVRQFVHMQTGAMLTLLGQDFTRQEMLDHAGTVVNMLRGAFRALLSQ